MQWRNYLCDENDLIVTRVRISRVNGYNNLWHALTYCHMVELQNIHNQSFLVKGSSLIGILGNDGSFYVKKKNKWSVIISNILVIIFEIRIFCLLKFYNINRDNINSLLSANLYESLRKIYCVLYKMTRSEYFIAIFF